MAEQLRLDGRVALVTGAGRGVGRGHAIMLASRGAKVVVNDFGGDLLAASPSKDPANLVVEEIRAAGGDAIANFGDIALPETSAAMVDAALNTWGSVDIVVANAGILHPQRPFAETSFDGLERAWRIHVGGTYNLIRAAWNPMVERGYGRIITTASAAGYYGQPGSPEYSAAKAGIVGLTLSVAEEAVKHGICANTIAPAGATRMSLTVDLDEQTEAILRAVLDPNLVAASLVWLAHESCPYNGALFEAGGGRMARVRIGEVEGHWTKNPTPEEFAAHKSDVDGSEFMYYTDALHWAGWLLDTAMKKRNQPA